MDALIQDLLSYSQLSQVQIPMQEVDSSKVVQDVCEQLKVQIKEAAAEIHIENQLPQVRANPQIFTQAITNLIQNAIKFVRPGISPMVRIRSETVNGRTRLWVEDNGIGISPEYRDRIFQVFERLHTPSEYPGTGIGLAIVRKAAERMNGTAGVESEVGQGSRFFIELPTA